MGISRWGVPLLTASLFWACSTAKHQSLVGISQEVSVRRDNWGINHIEAKNEQDLFFAQGYLAAKDRLFQFELWRDRKSVV